MLHGEPRNESTPLRYQDGQSRALEKAYNPEQSGVHYIVDKANVEGNRIDVEEEKKELPRLPLFRLEENEASEAGNDITPKFGSQPDSFDMPRNHSDFLPLIRRKSNLLLVEDLDEVSEELNEVDSSNKE